MAIDESRKNYVVTLEVLDAYNDKVVESENTIRDTLADKVDKVAGKGLSTNDLTDALLTKINNAGDYNNLTNKPGNATTTADGLMSKEDKAAVDAIGTTIDSKIAAQIAATHHFEAVDSLPATGEENVIYLVPKTGGTGSNVKDEYVYIGGKFELIGDSAPDMSGYLKTTTAENTYATKTALDDYLKSADASSTYLTKTDAGTTYATKTALDDYLKSADASSTYLTKTYATSTYLKKTDATSTYATKTSLSNYLTTANAASTYLTKTDAGTTYVKVADLNYATTSDIEAMFTE